MTGTGRQQNGGKSLKRNFFALTLIFDMENKKFKTNLKCAGCVAAIAPFMDETIGKGNWSVDLSQPLKTLMVSSSSPDEDIIRGLLKSGFKAERIDGQ